MNSIDAQRALRDPARLAALHHTQLLDSPPDEAFDRFTRLATSALHAPAAFIVLLDADRQFWKSAQGAREPWASRRGTPIEYSLCVYNLAGTAPLAIADVLAHPLIVGGVVRPLPGLAAYVSAPLRTAHGQPLGSFCVTDDVPRSWTPAEIAMLEAFAAAVMTEIERQMLLQETQPQAALAAAERRQAYAIFQTLNDACVSLDTDLRCLYANPAAARLLQTTQAALLGRPIAPVFDAVLGIAIDGELERAAAEAVEIAIEAWSIETGRWYEVRLYPGREWLILYARDITERKQMAAALERAEARFHAVAEITSDYVYDYRVDAGHIVQREWVTAELPDIIGWTPDELDAMGGPFSIAWPADHAITARRVERLLSGQQDTSEFRVLAKDGTVRWLRDSGRPLRDPADGRVIRIVGAVKDITAQKKAEQTLAQQDALLRAITDASPFGYLVVDNRTDAILYSNARFAELWRIEHLQAQLERGELRNKDLVPDCLAIVRDVPAFIASCQPLQSERNRAPVEDEIALVDGRALRRFSTQIRADDDSYVGRLYLFEDVTEQKALEAELRRREQQFRTLVENTPDIIVRYDRQQRQLYVSPAVEQITGLAAAAFLEPDAGGSVGALGEQWTHQIRYVSKTGRPVEFEFTFPTPSGTRSFEARLAAEPAPDGARRAVIGIIHDVTERELSARALRFLTRASEALATTLDYERTIETTLRSALPELADGAMLHLLSDTGIERPGAAHRDPAKETLIRSLQARYPIDLQGPHPIAVTLRTGTIQTVPRFEPDTMQRYLAGEDTAAVRVALGLGSGVCLPLIVRGRIIGALTLLAEQDDRYSGDDLALAEALAQRCAVAVDNARLYADTQQALQLRNDVLATITHDLRNPVTSIMGHTDLARRRLVSSGTIDPAYLMERLAKIDGAAGRMRRMLNELLDTARLESGLTLDLERTPTDLVTLLQQLVEEQRAASKLFTVELHTTLDSLIAVVDAARLERAVANLLTNAVKYSRQGATVTATLWREQDGGRSWAVIAIADQGVGIPEADLPRIFDRFHRAGNVRNLTGTGIGLASTRQIVEQHRGTIGVTSRQGQGSTFTLRLPLDDSGAQVE